MQSYNTIQAENKWVKALHKDDKSRQTSIQSKTCKPKNVLSYLYGRDRKREMKDT